LDPKYLWLFFIRLLAFSLIFFSVTFLLYLYLFK
jgi:hypothetical protein